MHAKRRQKAPKSEDDTGPQEKQVSAIKKKKQPKKYKDQEKNSKTS